MHTRNPTARRRMLSAVFAGVALSVTVALGGCSSTAATNPDGTTADPVLASAAGRLAISVSDRLAMMEQVAWVNYDAKTGIEDPRGDQIQITAFLKATQPAGVPKAVATDVIVAQLEAGRSVQRSLIQQWSTGVTPPPTGLPPNLAQDVAPKIAEYTADIAAGMRQVQVQGVPADWSQIMIAARDQQAGNLPESVTRTAYDQAIAPIAAWPPAK